MLTKFILKNIIRVGFIGLGNHALENLLPSILLAEGLQLTVISSRDPSKLQTYGNKFKPLFTTTDWCQVINPEYVELVVVSATPQIHYEASRECILKGIHCFIEKPPTLNIAQLRELLELKKATKVKTFVGFNYTYSDAYNKLLSALKNSEINFAKLRFIVGKLNKPTDGFETVLDSCLYKMFSHPMHTLHNTFGEFENLEVFEQVFEDNKFSMQVLFTFKNGSKAMLDWGNYSNRFECRFELTNRLGESAILDNMGHFELWGMQNHQFDKQIFKSKEKLVFDNSPLLGGYERTGYQREFELFVDAITNDTTSPCEIENSLEVYRAIEEVKNKSGIGF